MYLTKCTTIKLNYRVFLVEKPTRLPVEANGFLFVPEFPNRFVWSCETNVNGIYWTVFHNVHELRAEMPQSKGVILFF